MVHMWDFAIAQSEVHENRKVSLLEDFGQPSFSPQVRDLAPVVPLRHLQIEDSRAWDRWGPRRAQGRP